jgi:hypothetical protein
MDETDKTAAVALIIAISLVIIAGRATVPGHALSYDGSYEALAHIWAGVLIGLAWECALRVPALVVLGVISVVELAAFIARIASHCGK